MAAIAKRDRQLRDEQLRLRVVEPIEALINWAARLESEVRRFLCCFVAREENGGFALRPMPTTAKSALLYAFCCFPLASPAFVPGLGKQKTPRRVLFIRLIFLEKSGAGDGIRTLDPNLDKERAASRRPGNV